MKQYLDDFLHKIENDAIGLSSDAETGVYTDHLIASGTVTGCDDEGYHVEFKEISAVLLTGHCYSSRKEVGELDVMKSLSKTELVRLKEAMIEYALFHDSESDEDKYYNFYRESLAD